MGIRTLADIEAIESVPLAERALPASTYAALERSARQWPKEKALSFFAQAASFAQPVTWTYAELFAEVTRAANAFHAMGVGPEAPVAYVLPNLPETHFTIWGGEAAGVVMAINPLIDAAQIAELLRAARARVVVTVAEFWQKIAPHLAGDPQIQMLDIAGLRSAMAAQPGDRLVAPRAIGPGERSSYFCTGGTTGLPKIAVRTHGNEVFDAWAVASVLEPRNAPRTFFCGLPLFHVNAQLVTGLMPWLRGDHVVLGTPQGYRADGLMARFWEIVAHYEVTMFSGVPTIYAALLDVPVGAHDISSLQFAICGAAPMPAELIRAFEARTGLKILEGYGLTEGACVSSVNPIDGEKRPGSIGLRLPYQQMRAAILGEQGGFVRFAATGEPGVIVIHGPNVFAGYLDERHDRSAWVEIDGRKWLNTGDLGREDEQGYFWLTGRKKELIIRGGHNIDPKTIEEVLHRHPAVALAAAVGRPDGRAGELPVAYVQLKPDAKASAGELLAFAAEGIAERAAVPKAIQIVPALPLTSVGKIYKPALLVMEVERVVRAEAEASGATLQSLVVAQDPRRGIVARIRVAGDAAPLRAALGRYAFATVVEQ